MVSVKICGINDTSSLRESVRAGADFIGLVFYKDSPRFVTLEQAIILSGFSPDQVKIVGLFVDPSDEEIASPVKYAWLDMIQLHGSETPERVLEIKERFNIPVIKAIRISDESDLKQVEKYNSCADWLLFDAKPKEGDLPGGNGKSFDWNILKDIQTDLPWMLSGGINQDNVEQALEVLSPDAIDLSSGVEIEKGIKSPEKIRDFFDTLRQTGQFRPNYIRKV